MIWIAWIFGVLLVLAYGSVIPFGAPFLPTLKKERQAALDLLDLAPGQLFIDLGSGDGSLLAAAAEQGLQAVGYEINPFLAAYSWLRTRRFGRRVQVRFRSFWRADLSGADGMFVFLITHHMNRFAKMLDQRPGQKPLRVVSHAFEIPGQKPVKKRGALFLYIYN